MRTATRDKDTILLESGTNEVEFIEFFLGGISYGINVSKVQRVLALSTVKVSKIAQAPHCVTGMIHIHNKPVMLMDLKQALGTAESDTPGEADRHLVLVTKFNNVTTAFLIDGISKIHRTSWDQFEPIREQSHQQGGGFSTGTITLNDNIIIILDLERLMLHYFPSSHSHAHDVADLSVPNREGRDAIRIVYAEDSKMVRNLTVKVLNSAGYVQIAAFENGQDALHHISQISEEAKAEGERLTDRIDVVLTDIEMPKMDGLTLCKRVKSEIAPDFPPGVIVYSSLINKEMAIKCRSVGADAQLAKPEIEQIVALIDELCLDKKRP